MGSVQALRAELTNIRAVTTLNILASDWSGLQCEVFDYKVTLAGDIRYKSHLSLSDN